MTEKKCDHILGYHYFYDMLVHVSNKESLKKKGSFELFKYCPDCGELNGNTINLSENQVIPYSPDEEPDLENINMFIQEGNSGEIKAKRIK